MIRPLVLMSLLAVPAHASPADHLQSDTATGCRFIVPDGLAAGTASWLGECPGQLAEGLGVLRIGAAGHKPQLFAGLMHAGYPVRGLVDLGENATSDYGPAYRFDGAHAIQPTTREEMVSGFRTASDGAAAAASRLGALGNTSSAKFYADWSRELAKAPDQNE